MKKRNYKEALQSLRSVREGRVKTLDVLKNGSGDQDIIEEVDEERFVALKHERSVKDFIDRDIEDADDDDIFDDDDDAGEIVVSDQQKASHSTADDCGDQDESDINYSDPSNYDFKKRKREINMDIFSRELRSRKRRTSVNRNETTKSIIEMIKPKTAVEVEESKILAAMEFEDVVQTEQGRQILPSVPTMRARARFEPVIAKDIPRNPAGQVDEENDPIESPSKNTTVESAELKNDDGSESVIQTPTPPSNELKKTTESLSAVNIEERSSLNTDDVNQPPTLPCQRETEQHIAKLIGVIDFQDELKPTEFQQITGSERSDGLDGLDNKENLYSKRGIFFYFIDAYEPQAGEHGYGSVLLFGKVLDTRSQNIISACLVVQDVPRNVFLRPKRQPQNINDEAECMDVLKSYSEDLRKVCEEIDSSRIRVKQRRRQVVLNSQKRSPEDQLVLNRFELYFKMIYPGTAKPLSEQLVLSRCPNISHVFGCDRPLLETLMVKRRIMGPSWLHIKATNSSESAAGRRYSWCAAEFLCPSYKDIQPVTSDLALAKRLPTTPPMTMLSLSVKTARRDNSAASNSKISVQHDFKMLSLDMVINANCAITQRNSTFKTMEKRSVWFIENTDPKCLKYLGGPNKLVTNSLKEFINYAIHVFQKACPDIVVGHDLYGAIIPLLLTIIGASGNTEWSRFSKWKRAPMKLPSRWSRLPVYNQSRLMFCGILLCDTLKLSQEILGPRVTYALPALLSELFDAPGIPWEKKIVDGEQLYSCIDIRLTDNKSRLQDYLCLAELCGIVAQKISSQTTPPNTSTEQYMFAVVENICHNSGAEEAAMLIKLAEKLSMLPLSQDLAQLTGSLWERSLFCQRAERNEFLLLHKFRAAKWIPPSSYKSSNAQISTKNSRPKADDELLEAADNDAHNALSKGSTYEGGLVLDPKSGFYDTYILYLDFASLYPSIIQEFNLCFSTIADFPDIDSGGDIAVTKKTATIENEPLALLPSLLRDLVKERREVKSLMKKIKADSPEQQRLETKQKAVKLVANSIYGSLGFKNFRFYSPNIASRVTALGRHVLLMTKNKVEKSFGCSVIYGDTDSIMVDSGLKDIGRNTRAYYEALEKAHKIAQEINKNHNKLELEVETIFKKLLLLTKKKYAALKVSDMVNRIFEKEVKGLDIVRRDWCGITKRLGHEILDFLFTDNADVNEADDPALIATFVCDALGRIRLQMENDEIPLEEYAITKCLTKMPAAYSNPKNIPHVALALDLQSKGRIMHQGLNVSYVVCKEPRVSGDVTLGSRVYRPEDVHSLSIDKEWYKSTQIFPPIMRLCQYFDGLPSSRLAEALGCGFKVKGSNLTERDNNENIWIDNATSAVSCDMSELTNWARYGIGNFSSPIKPPYHLTCPSCGQTTEIELAMDEMKCAGCKFTFSIREVCIQVMSHVQIEYAHFSTFKTRCAACDQESFFNSCCSCGSQDIELAVRQSDVEGHIYWLIGKLHDLLKKTPEVMLLLEIMARFHMDDIRCFKILKNVKAEEEAVAATTDTLRKLLPMEYVDLVKLVSELSLKTGQFSATSLDGPRWVE